MQNADDAGAGRFCVLLDLREHGRARLACPGAAGHQGPAIVTYNDAVFTDTDFESIQHVGASRKAESEGRAKTGRFGVGFNSCYHATDLPSFLSRQFLVVFDLHCTHLPNASPHDPGKIIDFSTEGLAAQFPDTFAPYHVFGCETAAGEPFAGTIFRCAAHRRAGGGLAHHEARLRGRRRARAAEGLCRGAARVSASSSRTFARWR